MSRNYPSTWGQPPRIQSRDMVALPMGGIGPSTLRNWQNQKIQEFGIPTNNPNIEPPLPKARNDTLGYGDWINLPPNSMVTMDFRDQDGDKIDDRYQTGPGMTPEKKDGGTRLENDGTALGINEEPATQPAIDADIEYGDQKKLKKQLAKLNQDIRKSTAAENSEETYKLKQKLQRINDVSTFLKSGFSLDESKLLAVDEDKIRNSVTEKEKQRAQEASDQRAKNFIEQEEQRKKQAEENWLETMWKDVRAGYSPPNILPPGYSGPTIGGNPNPSSKPTQNSSMPANFDWKGRPPFIKPGNQQKPIPLLLNKETPLNINKLAMDAAAGGETGDKARAALTQRAAAGDPQAANTLKTLNVGMVSPQEADRILREDPNKYDRMKRAGQIPGNQKIYDEAVRDAQKMAGSRPSSAASQPRPRSRIIQPTSGQNQNISASGSGPRKEPTAEEMAASMDKQNRAKEMAAQAAQQRAANRKAAENQAARDAAARKMGFPNAAAAEKAGAKIGNIGDKSPSGGGGGGGRRGGGGGGGRGLTAKERNDLAAKRADQAARRVDSRGYADSAYRDYNADAAKWGDTPDQRRKRLEDRGLNPDYDGWKDNPQYRKDLEKAQSLGEHNKRGKWADVPTLSDDKNQPSDPADPTAIPDISMPQIGPSASNSSGGTWITKDGRPIRIA